MAGIFSSFQKSGHLEEPDYVIPLQPLAEAVKLKKFIIEARDKNTTEGMQQSFFYVKRRAEEDLNNNLDFQRSLAVAAKKF